MSPQPLYIFNCKNYSSWEKVITAITQMNYHTTSLSECKYFRIYMLGVHNGTFYSSDFKGNVN